MQSGESSLRRPFEDDSNDEKHDRKRSARTRKSPKLPTPLYKASATSLAETSGPRSGSATADIDDAIVLRIQKCLDRANHPNTPEAEAKAALHLASRLMRQYNISQADILAHIPQDSQKQYAGQSVVSIVRSDGDRDKPVRQQSYVDTLSWAMEEFFNCKSYSTARRSSVDLTFYGISQNSVTAAMAFEMTYNLIAEWARAYKGAGSKNSYCHGICDQLLRDAQRAKVDEDAQAKTAELEAVALRAKQEEAETEAQSARLEPPLQHFTSSESPSPEPQVKIEDDDGGLETFDEAAEAELDDFLQPNFEVKEEIPLDPLGDLDLEIENLVKIERLSPEESFDEASTSAGPARFTKDDAGATGQKAESQLPDTELDVKWQSHSQLVIFRNTASRIADDFLKEQGVKVSGYNGRKITIQDASAYRQGERDSSKIDVRRERLASS